MSTDGATAAVAVPSATTTGLVVVSVVFPVLSAIAVALRFVARRSSSMSSFYADDALLVVSWVSTFLLSVLVWVCADRSGIDFYDINPQIGIQFSLALIWLSSVILNLPLATVKIALLIFYKRLFPTPVFKKVTWAAIGVVTLWGIIFFFLILFQVDPISKAWTGTARLRYDSNALGLAQVASSIALDVIVLCFPLPVISRLKMDKSRKVALAIMFWLGTFCCVAAIVRLVLLDEFLRIIVVDPTRVHLQSTIIIWKVIEPNASIVAVCLPAYGPFLKSRALESIVRSVRSVMSLRSLGSMRMSRDRSGNGSDSKTAKRTVAADDLSATESQTELRQNEWHARGQEPPMPPMPASVRPSTEAGLSGWR